MKFPFLYFSCFRNIQPVKTILAPEDEYCFLLLLPQAIAIIMAIALINAKAKSVIACLRHHDTGHLSFLKLESLQSKV